MADSKTLELFKLAEVSDEKIDLEVDIPDELKDSNILDMKKVNYHCMGCWRDIIFTSEFIQKNEVSYQIRIQC